MKSLAYCRRVPGAPLTTSLPFHLAGQPDHELRVVVPAVVGVRRRGVREVAVDLDARARPTGSWCRSRAARPSRRRWCARSRTVPAVVRSVRQAVFCTSAPGTSIRDCRAQDVAASAGPGRAARPVVPKARARAASRVRERMLSWWRPGRRPSMCVRHTNRAGRCDGRHRGATARPSRVPRTVCQRSMPRCRASITPRYSGGRRARTGQASSARRNATARCMNRGPGAVEAVVLAGVLVERDVLAGRRAAPGRSPRSTGPGRPGRRCRGRSGSGRRPGRGSCASSPARHNRGPDGGGAVGALDPRAAGPGRRTTQRS